METLLSFTDFENNRWADGWGEVSSATDPVQRAASIDIIDTYDATCLSGRAHNRVAKLTLNRWWAFGSQAPRSQMILTRGPGGELREGHTYRLRWDMYLPATYIPDDPHNPEAFMGIHSRYNHAVAGSNPLGIGVQGCEYTVTLGANPVKGIWNQELARRPLSELAGHWNQFDIELRLSQKTDGYLVVRVNDAHIVDFEGNTNLDCSQYVRTGNPLSPHYWQIMIYKWWWLTRPSLVTERVLYIDNLTLSELA